MKSIFLAVIVLLASCQAPAPTQNTSPAIVVKPVSFSDYWYKGGAEITSYELQQARYGEVRTGKAVTVFVTEPFSASKQVKLDDYQAAGEDKVSVLKLNMMKNFVTGIYPYSMMLSTFTPMDGRPMIKSATSSQEWCGHTFLQINRQDSAYRWTGFSYFESEGDATGTFSALSEDQLWSTLRINPDQLPVGEIAFLPSTFYLRLKHRPIAPVTARGTLKNEETSEYSTALHRTYTLTYPDRSLKIYFESDLPYHILGWEETYHDGQGELTTKAKRIQTIRSKYWEKNSNADEGLRRELGL